jgi:hypothetical protein
MGLQTACPYPLIIHEVWDFGLASRRIEKELHDDLFTNERMRGEWFDIDPELARYWIEASVWLELSSQLDRRKLPGFGSRAMAGDLPPWRDVGRQWLATHG